MSKTLDERFSEWWDSYGDKPGFSRPPKSSVQGYLHRVVAEEVKNAVNEERDKCQKLVNYIANQNIAAVKYARELGKGQK